MNYRKAFVALWFVVFVVLMLYLGWQQFQIFRNWVLGESEVNPDQIRHQAKVLAFRPSIFVPYLVLAISAFIDTLF